MRLKGIASGGKFGFAAWVSDDLSSDGEKDAIVGAPDESGGRVYLFHGPFTGSGEMVLLADQASFALQSPDSDSTTKFGERVIAVPDLNNDGVPDVMIRGSGPNVSNDGMEFRTYFFSGADGTHIITARGADGFDDGGAQFALAEGGGLPYCCGDVAGGVGGGPDGVINTTDLLAVVSAWGTCPTPPAECPADCAPCENPDGQVNTTDLLQVISAWGACDFDNDGMPDTWEIENGLDPYSAGDAALDSDEDGLTNLQELQHLTNPFDADTDGDGAVDGAEVIAGSNPLNASDGGVGPNSDRLRYVMLRFGDHSCHNSELWHMRFNGIEYRFPDADASGCAEPPGATNGCNSNPPWNCPLYAVREKGPIPVELGQSYPIQMAWKDTAFEEGNPDYDWTCFVDACNASGGDRHQFLSSFPTAAPWRMMTGNRHRRTTACSSRTRAI